MNKLFSKLINEEIKNVLNEAVIVSDEKLTFEQRLNNSSFYNYTNFTNEYDTDVLNSDIFVKWKVSFWADRYGINKFIIDVEQVTGSFTLQYLDKHTGEVIQETPKNIGEFNWKFIIEEANLTLNSGLFISELVFDFKSNVCNVKF